MNEEQTPDFAKGMRLCLPNCALSVNTFGLDAVISSDIRYHNYPLEKREDNYFVLEGPAFDHVLLYSDVAQRNSLKCKEF